jgi:hypothetical protein
MYTRPTYQWKPLQTAVQSVRAVSSQQERKYVVHRLISVGSRCFVASNKPLLRPALEFRQFADVAGFWTFSETRRVPLREWQLET